MSRVFNKNNKISKPVALMLALLLLITPFFAHEGLQKRIKAATPSVAYTTNGVHAVSLQEDSGLYYIKSTNNKIATLKIASDSVNVTFGDTLASIKDLKDITVAAGFNVDLKIMFNPASTPDYVSDSTQFDTVQTKELTNAQKLYVYAAITSVDADVFKKADGTFVAPEEVDTAKYSLIGYYDVSKINPWNGPNVTPSGSFVKDGAFTFSGLENFSKTGNVNKSGSDIYIGKINFAVMKKEVGKSNDYYLSNANWKSAVNVTDTSIVDGEQVACVAYMNGDGEIIQKAVVSGTPKVDKDTSLTYEIIVEEIKFENGGWNTVKAIDKITSDTETLVWHKVNNKNYGLRVKANKGDGSNNTGIQIFAGGEDKTISISDNEKVAFIVNGQEVTNLTKVVIKDSVGNTKTINLNFIDDSTNPVVSALTVAEGDASVVSAPAGVYKKPQLSYSVTDNKKLDKVKFLYTLTQNGTFNDNNVFASEQNVTGTSDAGTVDVSSGITSGTYYVKAVVSDKAGNIGESSSAVKIIYDKDAPNIKNVNYWCRSKENGAWGNWTKIDESTINVNTGAMSNSVVQYSVTFEVKDSLAGIDATSIAATLADENSDATATDTHVYRYTVKITDVDKATDTTFTFKDKIGNATTGKIPAQKFQQAAMDVQVVSESIKIYEKGNPSNTIDVPFDDVNVNKKYVVEAKVLSPSMLATAQINAVDAAGNNVAIDATVSDKAYDHTVGRFSAKIRVELPEITSSNQLLDGCTIYVVDETDNFGTFPLGTLLYDINQPYIAEANNDNEWHKSFELKYVVKSGNAASESDLVRVGWTITNIEGSDIVDKFIVPNDQVNKRVVEGKLNIPESISIYGTKVTFTALDKSGNTIKKDNKADTMYVKVDKTNPVVDLVAFDGSEIKAKQIERPYSSAPEIKVEVSDNFTIDKIVCDVTYPDGTVKTTESLRDAEYKNISDETEFKIKKLNGEVPDGTYKVDTYVYDKAGNRSQKKSVTFVLDSTDPTVSMKVVDGTASKKTKAPYYYRSDVTVKLTCEDANPDKLIVSDNKEEVRSLSWKYDAANGVSTANYKLSEEGLHQLTFKATDKANNKSELKRLNFVIDKTNPTVSAIVNGSTVYTDNLGVLMLASSATVAMNVTDMTVDNDNYLQVLKTVPDQQTTQSGFAKTSETTFSFGEDAEYSVNFYTIDKAENKSATKTVRFRVDQNAPVLNISGAVGGTSANAATVNFSMQEAFWWDAKGTITIYRKPGDGSAETLMKTIDVTPTSANTSISETLTETGVYRFEFTANDRVGHTASQSNSLTIDRDAPVITLTGVNDYDKTDKDVGVTISITDDFFTSKIISIIGTKTDKHGQVSPIEFKNYNAAANPTVINNIFATEGIYDIEVTAKDVAGNTDTAKVHFIIDKEAPEINDIAQLADKVLTSFEWAADLDDLVSDLTVCDVHMYLNGVEYDGVSQVEDGSYVLLISAKDELGHSAEKEIKFELDTKAPVFIITGVEENEVKKEPYTIDVSLQLEEDMLTSVTLNGKPINISENTCQINVTEHGSYTLELKAVDKAGNETVKTIDFRYGSKLSNWWIWLIVAGGIVLIAGIIIVVVKKKRD